VLVTAFVTCHMSALCAAHGMMLAESLDNLSLFVFDVGRSQALR
jgi:hypothetical protein